VSGLFLTFEGVDGSGKSTQARLLADRLRADGCEVVLTREPGGSAGGEDIRKLLLEGDPDRWSPETEILLFTAARRDHLERVIRPALAAGHVVISDRFADSTRIYQGVTRGDLRTTVDKLHSLMIAQEPDLTFLVDIDPTIGLRRALARRGTEERFEEFGLSMQQKMRAGFLDLARDQPDRFRIIDGHGDLETVAKHIDAALAKFDTPALAASNSTNTVDPSV
jgi:dTMP kinase